MGTATESSLCWTSLFWITPAYESVTSTVSLADGGRPAAIPVRALPTSDQTFAWSLFDMAFERTEGCTIAVAAPNFTEFATQRPGSTQKTLRSMGSLSAGTKR